MLTKLWALGLKDTLVRFSNRSEYLFFLILPLFFTVLLAGVAVPGGGDQRLPLAVVDADDSPLSGALLARLAQSPTLAVTVRDDDAAAADFAAGRATAVLTIPTGFAAGLQNGAGSTLDLLTQPNDLNGLALTQAVQQAATAVSAPYEAARQAVRSQALAQPFTTEAAAATALREAQALASEMAAAQPERLLVQEAGAAGPDESNPQQQAIGQLLSWALIPLLGIGTLMAYERQNGTLRRLAATPTAGATYFLGTISGQTLTAGVQMLLLLGFGALVLGLDWGDSPAALALLLFSFTLAAAAMGTALGAFVGSVGQARGLSILGGMILALLGGAWIPIEIFPAAVQSAVRVLPTTWAMQGLLDVILRGHGLMDILPETAVLLGFAALFFTIGVRRFRFA